MNKNQTAALNNLLTALAAFLLTLRESGESEPEHAPDTDDKETGTEEAPEAGVDDLLGDEEPKPEAEAKPDKKKAAEEKKAAKAKEEAEKKAKEEAEKKAAAESKPIAPTNPDTLLADARAAAVSYAGKHGREALRALLNEFTKGTIAEIPKEQLPAVIAKLKA
jgi:colicin import membrane protein